MLLPLFFAVLLGQTPYAVPINGAVSMSTDGSGTITVGYGQLQPDPGSSTPATLSILDQRIGGVLVNETGMPETVTPQATG
jgi:hypothetical protein